MPTTHTHASLVAMPNAEAHNYVQSLLGAQMRELAQYANEPRWQQAQWTDSDYDYMGAALDAAQSLLVLAYEGSPTDLADWLYNADTDGAPSGTNVTLAQLAGDGLAPELQAYYDAAANLRDNG